jgi:hypothetical protein
LSVVAIVALGLTNARGPVLARLGEREDTWRYFW